MVKNGHSSATDGLSFGGCSCHNTPNARRKAKKGAKAKDNASWKRAARSRTGDGW